MIIMHHHDIIWMWRMDERKEEFMFELGYHALLDVWSGQFNVM